MKEQKETEEEWVSVKISDDPERWEEMPKWMFSIEIEFLRLRVCAENIIDICDRSELFFERDKDYIKEYLSALENMKHAIDQHEEFFKE